ncbi:hypothetical protein SAMD00019534_076180 [Acytostelium subglobosum LB1]|uniref:hypothetical protein n=1 Tax=Acytostelium subglobosum LB1 TaxID=1410327 RepID=UPI000644CD8B|nr:hypothetical protein SAMD00019534_076180 [Acytostelium subglobosum LB1]GAM24443.1 hypothetical protein SAMD00019534_076180 [Acytostelium subglobosum LB1]|eukprot:XP_012752769.1 hypothetical protein SAMD00019534_076180 [Acytostelium subglobosum LB1]
MTILLKFILKREVFIAAVTLIAAMNLVSMLTTQYQVAYTEIYYVNGVRINHHHERNIDHYGIHIVDYLKTGHRLHQYHDLNHWTSGYALFTSIITLKTVALATLLGAFAIYIMQLRNNYIQRRLTIYFVIIYNVSFLLMMFGVLSMLFITLAFRDDRSPDHCVEQGQNVRQCRSIAGSLTYHHFERYEWGPQFGWFVGLVSLFLYSVIEIPVLLQLREATDKSIKLKDSASIEAKDFDSMHKNFKGDVEVSIQSTSEQVEEGKCNNSTCYEVLDE